MQISVLHVPNINCGHCVATIEREIGLVSGVVRVTADAGKKRVSITWKEPASWQLLRAKLEEIGFPSEES